MRVCPKARGDALPSNEANTAMQHAQQQHASPRRGLNRPSRACTATAQHHRTHFTAETAFRPFRLWPALACSGRRRRCNLSPPDNVVNISAEAHCTSVPPRRQLRTPAVFPPPSPTAQPLRTRACRLALPSASCRARAHAKVHFFVEDKRVEYLRLRPCHPDAAGHVRHTAPCYQVPCCAFSFRCPSVRTTLPAPCSLSSWQRHWWLHWRPAKRQALCL